MAVNYVYGRHTYKSISINHYVNTEQSICAHTHTIVYKFIACRN